MKILRLHLQQIIRFWKFSCVKPSTTLARPLNTKKQSCIGSLRLLVIERHKDEIPNLIDRYGGQMALEIRFAGELRFLANNERAIQTRQIKSTYLGKQNPECRLAENVIESELDLDQTQPPRIHKNNIGHIKSIGALRDLLVSPKMYQDQVLFNIFCLGLESGNFRQN